MLENFRKIIQGWLGKVLIGVLLLPFALFGVSSIFQVDPNKKTVVEVNGVEIGERELLRAVEVSKQNLIGQLGEQASSFVTNEMVRPQALEGLISQELLRQSVEENGLDVSMGSVHKMIMDMEVFHLDGQFSQSHFEALLRRNGLQPERFPDKMRDDFLQRQMSSGYQATSFSTASEIGQLERLYKQTRSFSYAEIRSDIILKQVSVTDSEIQAYYDENKETYRTDEQVSFDYFTINKSDFAGDLTTTEKEIEQRYEEKLVEIEESQERSASHILIEVNDKRTKEEAKVLIDKLFSELSNGGDFTTLAKNHSDDKGSSVKGGFLGFAGRGVYVDEFEEALFSLQPSETSEPILTEFGFHIIRLDGLQPELQSLSAMRPELTKEIQELKAEQPYLDALEELRGLAYESSDLAEPAAFLKKEIKSSQRVSKNASSSDVLLGNPAVIDAVFSKEVLEDGNNSDVIELDDNRSVVLRLKDHFASKIRPIDDVKPQINAKLTQVQLKDKIKVVADELVVSLKSGVAKDELAASYSLTWKNLDNIKRDESSVPAGILSQLFKQPKPDVNKPHFSSFTSDKGQQIVAILTAVNAPSVLKTNDNAASDESLAAVTASDYQFGRLLENQKGAVELQSFKNWLKQEADIKEL
ncbi:MAG: SurA N-terminal domain-containing protein [Gammaproteobacteria bacterium]|nr:SurA N-terminal domain-containing protein [Gammaproteobacteria bacterium]